MKSKFLACISRRFAEQKKQRKGSKKQVEFFFE